MTDLGPSSPYLVRFSGRGILPPRLGASAASFTGLMPWLVPLALLAIWQTGSRLGFIPATHLPAPSDVARAAWRLTANGELLENIAVSFRRAITGFLVGGSLAFAFGLANGLSKTSERLTDSTFQMVRNIPNLALIPLVILWFGIEEGAKLFLTAFGVFFPSISIRSMAYEQSTLNCWKWRAPTASALGLSSGRSSCPARFPQSSWACAMPLASCG